MSKNKDKTNVNIDEECQNVDTATNNQGLDVDKLNLTEAKEMIKSMLASVEETTKDFEQLEETLKKTEADAETYKDSWYRTAAEFENFKKRNQETRKLAYFDGKKDVLTNILVIGDSIERALLLEMDEKTKEGVLLIYRQFQDTLTSMGVKEINPLNQVFNPENSEAIATLPTDNEEENNLVKTVFKKGYSLDDKIIRYCQVVVAKTQS